MQKISVLVCVVLAACGGDDGGGIGPGSQSYQPPAEGSGSGKPSDATNVTCTNAADDCGYWFCRCSDGAVVNSALCVNGFCMGAASACPRACEYFGHGTWTGEAGGGPQEMVPTTCGGLGSSKVACDSCMRDQCCDEASACGNTNSCLSYWDCSLECDGDPSCLDQCEATYPGGVAPYEGLRNCLLDNCYSQCVGEL